MKLRMLVLSILALAGVILFIYTKEQGPEHGFIDPVSPFIYETAAERDYTIGDFTLAITGKEAADFRLILRHPTTGDRAVWETVPGMAFVMAAQGDEEVSERKGSFKIRDRIRSLFLTQRIDGIEQDQGSLRLKGVVSNGGEEIPYVVTFTAVTEDQCAIDARIDDERVNRIIFTSASSSEEQFFGFGEQFSYVNMKGRRVPIFIMEQGVGRGAQPITLGANLTAGAGGDWHTTYAGVPQYITSAMRSFFLENHEYSSFDMRDREMVQVRLFSTHMKARVIAGTTPGDLIESYTRFSGRMRELPDWVHSGAILGLQGGTDKVEKIVKEMKELDTPVAGLWLQDWVGHRVTSFGKQLWWNWQLDRQQYPRWEEMVARMKASGIKIMAYVNPFLADATAKKNLDRHLLVEAREKGYLVKKPDGSDYLIENTDFDAGLVDISNPDARQWLKDVMRKEMLSRGVSGWMADFGEALPYDAVLHNGVSGAQWHNRYPEEWARLNRELVEDEENSSELVFFMRAGYTRSPKYSTLFWEGDQLVSWDRHDGIKTAVTGLISSGLSGYAFNHSDIGGYTAIKNPVKNYFRSRELLLRWMELSAFTAIYRTHEGNRPEDNHQFYDDKESMAHFSRMAKVFAALQPYRKELIREAAKTGMPVVRHPFIHYPEDRTFHNFSYQQFMLGRDFMVAPVLDPGKHSVKVYLPAGEWIHLWSGEVFKGDAGRTVKIAAPLGEPGVFFRGSSTAGKELLLELKKRGVL